jgi:hypothetical protein
VAAFVTLPRQPWHRMLPQPSKSLRTRCFHITA